MKQNKENILQVFELRDAKGKKVFSQKVKDDFNESLIECFDEIKCSEKGLTLFDKNILTTISNQVIFISPIKEILNDFNKSVLTRKNINPDLTKNQVKNELSDYKETKLKELIQKRDKFIEEFGSDPFYNYKYREMMVELKMQKFDSTYLRHTSKIDFVSDTVSRGEVKSCKVNRLKSGEFSFSSSFQFDKQNDASRRDNTLLNDGYVFAPFEEGAEYNGPICLMYIGPKFANQVHRQIEKKQNDFIEKTQNTEKQLSRDTIDFSVKDILKMDGVVFLKDGKEVEKEVVLKLFKEE